VVLPVAGRHDRDAGGGDLLAVGPPDAVLDRAATDHTQRAGRAGDRLVCGPDFPEPGGGMAAVDALPGRREHVQPAGESGEPEHPAPEGRRVRDDEESYQPLSSFASSVFVTSAGARDGAVR